MRYKVEEQSQQRYLDWNIQSESGKIEEQLDTWKSECVNAATNSLIKVDLLAKLAEILRYPNDRNCPSGLY